jgi:DNA-binding transcriptional LysR family regulator
LSRQIKALEQEFGAELYARTGRGIVLTEAGKVFEQHARGVLETTAGARSAISALGATPTGRVVIGMPPSVGAVLTATLVRQFRSEFPKVSLGVMEADCNKGDSELGLHFGPELETTGLECHRTTSFARSNTDSGIVSLSAFAVLRLTTNSNWVGSSMGSSPGFEPLRILST